MSEHQAVVIGAGPAGVAAAVALKDVGVRPLVVDEADEVASAWRARYDRLRLNTCRPYSHLPGRKFSKGTPMFPSRDEFVEHLDRHAREPGIEFQLGTRVARIDRSGDRWTLDTSEGELRAPQVVVATGYEAEPIVPDWPGRERFGGPLIHSREYRNPDPFQDKLVLVVGPGCSGMEIAYDLAEGGAARVRLAVRTPPNIIIREPLGPLLARLVVKLLPTARADRLMSAVRRKKLGDLSAVGLPEPEEGVVSRLKRLGVAPAILDHEVIDAVKEGRIEVVAGVEALDERGVTLADGARIEPDALIAATGYRRGLEAMVGHLGVLGEHGAPVTTVSEAAPGLRFVGYVPQPGLIGRFGKEARTVAREIAAARRSGSSPRRAATTRPQAAQGA